MERNLQDDYVNYEVLILSPQLTQEAAYIGTNQMPPKCVSIKCFFCKITY